MVRNDFLLSFFAHANTWSEEQLFSFLEYESGGLAASMFLGTDMDNNQLLYKSAKVIGILDIFSVSGMHVTSLWYVSTFLVAKCCGSKRVQSTLSLLVLVGYFLLVGMQLPIIRAVSMRVMPVVVQLILGRQLSPLVVLYLLVFFYLFFQPVVFSRISFQYSYLVTWLVIVYGKSPTENLSQLELPQLEVTTKLSHFLFWVRSSWFSSWLAQAGIVPLCLVHFGYWNPLGLFVSPFVSGIAVVVYLLTGVYLFAALLPLPGLIKTFCGLFLYASVTCFEQITSSLLKISLVAIESKVSVLAAGVIGLIIWLTHLMCKGRNSVFKVI